MTDSRPSRFPKEGSNVSIVARYLTGNSHKYNGMVPLRPYFEEPGCMGRDDFVRAMFTLRSYYKYYCKLSTSRHNYVECALDWPTVSRVPVWTSAGDYVVKNKLGGLDPRLDGPPAAKWKYTRLTPRTLTHIIAIYMLKNRDGCHVVDLSSLFAQHGFRRCRNIMNSLNKNYGFRITKLTKVHDCYYRVERERNYRIGTLGPSLKDVDPDFVTLSEEDWKKKFET